MSMEQSRFNRQLDERPTPRERFERVLAGMPLHFSYARDPVVEWAAFPSMVAIYWQLVKDGLPPTQAAFAQTVAQALGEPQNPAVQARARRAYPSLVRQHHAEVLLRERFAVVIHDEGLDHAGVDLLVVDGCFAVGLALSVNTAQARSWRDVKQRRHSDPPGLPILDVFAEPEAYRVGAFWLHPPTLADEVEAFIERERTRC
jgi:hypothetical protein